MDGVYSSKIDQETVRLKNKFWERLLNFKSEVKTECYEKGFGIKETLEIIKRVVAEVVVEQEMEKNTSNLAGPPFEYEDDLDDEDLRD